MTGDLAGDSQEAAEQWFVAELAALVADRVIAASEGELILRSFRAARRRLAA